jgi:hypothetical protein
MNPDDDKTRRLPVTAEVGDEGGSYADATQQAETFSGVFGNPRVDRERTAATAPAAAADRDASDDDEITHATDRPEPKR